MEWAKGGLCSLPAGAYTTDVNFLGRKVDGLVWGEWAVTVLGNLSPRAGSHSSGGPTAIIAP
jgi:hypothetical protein